MDINITFNITVLICHKICSHRICQPMSQVRQTMVVMFRQYHRQPNFDVSRVNESHVFSSHHNRLSGIFDIVLGNSTFQQFLKLTNLCVVLTNYYLQVTLLEERFKHQHYVSAHEREEIARELQLSATQIKIWFQVIHIHCDIQ